MSHFGLLQRRVRALPVDHAEGDALGLRRERPGDGGPGCVHHDGDGAVAAGLDEQLPAAVLQARDVIHREVDVQPVAGRRGKTDTTMKAAHSWIDLHHTASMPGASKTEKNIIRAETIN